MQKKHLIGAGITAFSVILGLLWLIPLIWLIGTAFSVPSFHMTLFPTTAFTLDNIKYVWNAIPFGTYYINTLTLVVCTFAVQFFTSCSASTLNLFQRHWLKPQRSTVPTHGRPSGVYICPVQNRHIFPLPLSLSATTGTTICGL